jgi:hypothetical protein
MNKLRVKTAEAIRAHQHYMGWAIAWNVKIYKLTDPNEAGQLPPDEWNTHNEYDYVIQGMWESLGDREDEFKGEFHSEGRSSGWLVLSKFEGHVLGKEILEELQATESSSWPRISNEWCRRFLKMLPVWDEDFKNPGQVAQENLNDQHAYCLECYTKEKDEKLACEERDICTV